MHRVWFEDVVGEGRHEAFAGICRFLGVPFSHELKQVVSQGLPPVMATARPRQRRWFARAEMIEPVLETPAVAETAQAIGYNNRSEWI